MVSRALEIPTGSIPFSRGGQANRSLGRRAFIVTFAAAAGLALATLAAVQFAIRAEIRADVIRSLRESEHSLEQAQTARNLLDARVLSRMTASPPLASAILRVESGPRASASGVHALKTLRRIARAARGLTGEEFATISGMDGRPLAAFPADPRSVSSRDDSALGFRKLGGTLFKVASVPVRSRGRVVGSLSVASPFDFSGLDDAGVALLHRGQLVRSTPFLAAAQIAALPVGCFRTGCESPLSGRGFLVTPVGRSAAFAALDPEDQLLVLQPIDAAVDRIMTGLRTRLRALAAAVGLLAVCLGAVVSRTLSQPLDRLIVRLEQRRHRGNWDADFPEDSSSREVNLLAAAINRAAIAVNHSNERLDRVSLDFVETMAQALDARDPYTAGHSARVSEYATAIAVTMGLAPAEVEIIRQGARLHDIGKIGISDTLLRKVNTLTPDEYNTIKLHPQIGKKILERVAAFTPYLPLVELHHEDLDGGGYPYGLKGQEIPLAVRIVRVADVFDALTTDRAYRPAMSYDQAYRTIQSRAGTKFDPDVVASLRVTLGSLIASDLAGTTLS